MGKLFCSTFVHFYPKSGLCGSAETTFYPKGMEKYDK